MSATPQPQQSTAAEAVRPVSLESLVTETNVREPVRSLNHAKTELLERVGYGSQAPGAERPQSEEERVGYLLEVLEGNYTPILTIGFFNFAAQVRKLGFPIGTAAVRAERAGATHADACTRMFVYTDSRNPPQEQQYQHIRQQTHKRRVVPSCFNLCRFDLSKPELLTL